MKLVSYNEENVNTGDVLQTLKHYIILSRIITKILQ